MIDRSDGLCTDALDTSKYETQHWQIPVELQSYGDILIYWPQKKLVSSTVNYEYTTIDGRIKHVIYIT